MITKDVLQLRDQFHLPGMRVLQFAFDGDPQNIFLPEHHVHNAVAYTGTHDNDTTRGWYARAAAPSSAAVVWKHLKRPVGEEEEVAWELIEAGLCLAGGAGHRAAAGPAEPWFGGADEHPRRGRGELALAIPVVDTCRKGLRPSA